ncbi:Uncharacterised protein [uncultured archaeon]|nr:Uncharacterised protein [uncultured archaeon]
MGKQALQRGDDMKKMKITKLAGKKPALPSLRVCLESALSNTGVGQGAVEDMIERRKAGQEFDYSAMFTNELSRDDIYRMQQALFTASTPQERDEAVYTINATASFYAVVVYYIYPNKDWLKKTIESNQELSTNFKMVKSWLDTHNGKEVADYLVSQMQQAAKGEFVK